VEIQRGRQRGAGGAYRRHQVERQAVKPLFVDDVQEPCQARRDRADVVDQDVEAPVRQRGGDEAGRARGGGQIDLDHLPPSPCAQFRQFRRASA